MSALDLAIQILGSQKAVALAAGVRQPAVARWVKKGCLPYTDYTGETDYAGAIAAACDAADGGRRAGAVTRGALLAMRSATSAPNGASAERAVAGQGVQCMAEQYGAGVSAATRTSGEEVSCQS